MARFLPPQPNLDHLKNEAKALLKTHAQGDASICDVFRRLHRFTQADNEQILLAVIALNEAQLALALEYGFSDWGALRKAVLDCKPLEGSEVPPEDGALRLPDCSAAKSGAHRLTSAYQLALSYCGVDCDYDTITGDSGMAFILQADSLHTAWGAKRKELDIGYWPVDQWGSLLQLDFLERVYGYLFCVIREHEDEYKNDETEHFKKYFQPAIEQSLREGHPALGLEGSMWIITGIDNGTPPLLGQLTCSDKAETQRLSRYPWSVIVMEKTAVTLDRLAADAEAIDYAVRLHNDLYGRLLPGKTSGRASFTLWSRLLRDPEMHGPHFYNANVVGQLRLLRASAPPYLREMALRHDQTVAGHLQAAAGIYERVVAKLATADTSKTAFETEAGPKTLALLVDEIATLEDSAVRELALAAKAMK